ncbi:amidohydrolase [Beutenbergia cavernae DSM 12333]|uniref:Peptidase M20 domain-containing protein 2 n=1 Tax=Beutenbergia cavernae (strain ATCC BAA-8 / DSM 12333 / CCUG 43141 / JCM 11478 / NBRC 16432 / NCIMB 13614 / HKI 0122) TaxID=471853 RepID=C5C632_BEUC1|nr:amidohydrolase [Beutenbergia cavernae]ACQ82390.1 amidohydrolase [Beutenbergia cavernae DSM 12333]
MTTALDHDAVAPPEREAHPLAARVDEVLTGLLPDLRQLADELHDDPETAYEEHRSAARVAALLERHGVAAQVGAFGLPTALHANAGDGGPRVAILAEYDALPDIGHACGHNLIAATAVGAFLAVRELLEHAGGTVELIGSPAEEGGGGKQRIIDAGGFEGVAAAVMVHPGNRDRAYGSGLGMRHVEVTYRGVEAHASAAPERGYNALDAVVTAYQSVAQVRQHILPTDRVHGIITDGGQAPNIVPGRAAAHFFVRSATIDGLEALSERVDAALRGAAISTGTEAEIVWDRLPAYLPVNVNQALADRFAANLRGRREFPPPSPAATGGGSTDLGNVSHVVPAIHPNIATAPEGIGAHTAAFAATTLQPLATQGVLDAAFGLATTVLDVLGDAELRAAIAADFEASREGDA